MGSVHSCGPNQAVVISGSCLKPDSKTTVVGNWGWSWWCVSHVQTISLALMTLEPFCKDILTAEGIPITVTGVAQVKILSQEPFLGLALEQFLGKSELQIKSSILQTLEGHLRAIVGILTVEEIYKWRRKCAQTIQDLASVDLAKMGMEIRSFTLKKVNDDVDFLDSLGKAETARVKSVADIGVAEDERDTSMKESECKKDSDTVKYGTAARIALNTKDANLQLAYFHAEITSVQAEADLAYAVRKNQIKQEQKQADMEITLIERKKMIEIEEKEMERKEKDLKSSVFLPADAEAYRIKTITEGMRKRNIFCALGQAESIKRLGVADAIASEAVGKALAKGMRAKAEAYKKYEEQACIGIVVENLQDIAREVCKPLHKTRNILLLDGEAQ